MDKKLIFTQFTVLSAASLNNAFWCSMSSSAWKTNAVGNGPFIKVIRLIGLLDVRTAGV